MPENTEKDTLHPVRFARKQVEFIEYMVSEKGMEYWEEECIDLLDTINGSEE